LTEVELKEKQEKEKQRERFINPDFYSPGGKIGIPGSSLRGMIRTLVEIVSFGKFVSFDGGKKFFFRALGDRSLKLRNFYSRRMTTTIAGYLGMTCSAGYLFKDTSGKFCIRPAQTTQIGGHDISIFKVNRDLISSISVNEYEKNTYKVSNSDIYFTYEKKLFWDHRGGRLHLFYSKATGVSSSLLPDGLQGRLVCTGLIPGKKHFQHIILPPDDAADVRVIDEEVIKDYINDPYRRAVNLIELADIQFPCFYLEENGRITAFGHTPYFRLSYKNRIKDLVPEILRDQNKIDLATALFGNETDFSGRVFFEDASLENNDTKNYLTQKIIPKILSEPKPTSFQHYLEQPQNVQPDRRSNYTSLNDYNENHRENGIKIRGYKLYWHKKDEILKDTWQETEIEIEENIIKSEDRSQLDALRNTNNNIITLVGNKYRIDVKQLNSLPDNDKNKDKILKIIAKYDTQHMIIKAIKAGASFSGRIRFENLSDVELGALLFILDLPDNCRHKIGMGKPLGLGSIKIEPELFISNRDRRYRSIECEWPGLDNCANNEGNMSYGETADVGEKPVSIADFKEQFARFVLNKLGQETDPTVPHPSSSGLTSSSGRTTQAVDALWKTERLQELKALLSYDPSPDASYPGVSYYRSRQPMRKASDINRLI